MSAYSANTAMQGQSPGGNGAGGRGQRRPTLVEQIPGRAGRGAGMAGHTGDGAAREREDKCVLM